MAYCLEEDSLTELKDRIQIISRAIEKAGGHTFAHIRDEQNWKPHFGELKTTLKKCFYEITNSDVVVLDFTRYENRIGTGISIEAGYAKALNKKIISIAQQNDRPKMISELVETEIHYSDYDELYEKVFYLFSNQ